MLKSHVRSNRQEAGQETYKTEDRMKVYLIEQELEDSYCGIGGITFCPEIYTDKNIAAARIAELTLALGKYSGKYYTMQEVELDKAGD